jgi:hypothetical protein
MAERRPSPRAIWAEELLHEGLSSLYAYPSDILLSCVDGIQWDTRRDPRIYIAILGTLDL